jgi:L-ascorbate metabolism protein UlaG (beta-lactamase superfamily)
MPITDLPRLDAIVLSHMHGDHWDRVARRGLPRAVPIVTTGKAARALRRQGFTAAQGLRTWQDAALRRDGYTLTITSVPGRHAPGVFRHLLPPVMGSVLTYTTTSGPVLRMYITGDTLLIDDLREIPRRFPDIDTAVLHLGGTTLPGGLVVTMDAGQGADLIELVRPRVAIPIHNDDYGVFRSPLSAFLDETAARGLETRVRVVRPGETIDVLE